MGGGCVENVPIIGGIDSIKSIDFDEIVIGSLTGYGDIRKQLIEAGLNPLKINDGLVDVQVNARINFLRDFSVISPEAENKDLSVAEGGVFQGEFAKEINRWFPLHKLFLFDTFEGFDARDISSDKEKGFSNSTKENYLSDTSVELVLNKLPHKEKAVVRKGFFPDTAKGLENEKFLFVNIDFDLYDPILEGLRFFYPRMVDGGVILVHDFFSVGYKGVRAAVDKFEVENGKLIKFPIGDHISIGIMKK